MTFSGSGIIGELSADGRTLRLTRDMWVPLFIGSALTSIYPRGFAVPAGFVTDFASIPRGLWSLFPPTGEYAAAAVAHDYLYQHGIGLRLWADKLFLDRMEALGVKRWKRELMYRAVRLFGGVVWKRYRKERTK